MNVAAWKTHKIGELGEIITGRTPPSSMAKCFGDCHPFITPTDMKGDKWARVTERCLSDAGAHLLRRNRLPTHSVCVSCIGWQMGKVIMAAKPSFTNQQLNSIIPNERVHPDFLYYSLSVRREELLSLGSATGVRTPILNKSAFASLPIRLPPLAIQRKTAAILSAYDDLIENNARRIGILEEMARMLYREWFVDFRCPGHESVRMVDSSLGPIPDGWENGSLGEVLAEIESGSRPRGGIDPADRDVPSIGAENIIGLGRYDYAKEKYVSWAFFDGMKHGHVRSGDVLLYKDGAHVGRKSMFRDGFPHATCCVNEHVFILRTNGRCSQSYLYFWLDQPDVTQQVKNLNANAAQPGINQPGVRGLPIMLPDVMTLTRFEELIEPSLAELFNLAKANNLLRRTRDLVLPKLVSGELDVEDLDIEVGELSA